MADSRKLWRFVAGALAVALFGAAQPPGSTPTPVQPPNGPGAPGVPQPGGPDVLPPLAVPTQPVPSQPGPSGPQVQVALPFVPPGRQFEFKIDPKATAKDLLPPAPKARAVRGPVTTDDLKAIPEIEFEARGAEANHDKRV